MKYHPLNDQSLPRPEWEPTMHLILAVGMVFMIFVSILTAYLEAMLYLRSQDSAPAQLSNSQTTVTQNNHHNHGGNNNNNKDYERTNCSNHSGDLTNKDRSNGSGNGATAAVISASISSQHQQSSSLAFNVLSNGKTNTTTTTNNNINTSKNNTSTTTTTNNNNNHNNNSNGKFNCSQKRRKNSSTTNKSIGSTTSDKKSSSPYAPIFQNLTNVIASPPPPLPTFDNEFNSIEFKKLRSKKSAKKSNSLNGSIASSDDICTPSSLNQNPSCTSSQTNKSKSSGKVGGLKMNGSNSIGSEREIELQARLEQADSRISSRNREDSLKDVFTTAASSLPDEDSNSANLELYNGVKVDPGQQEQPTVMPIQPPSSLSSTPSSSSSSTASTSSSSSSSSTSSSPPLSASSYGEYSLLGPGATFELPCLRVRSAQI